MSVPRGFGLNGKSIFANITKLMLAELQFTVTPTNGLGVTSIKSNGYVENVFMHTSTTPAVGGNGLTNPNPAAGYVMVQMKQNFNKFLGLTASFQVPTATSTKIDNSALTIGNPYVISILGDSTAAQWASIGVPAGVVPAVGVAFVATAVGITGEANASTSRVQVPGTAAISQIEVIGNTNLGTTAVISSQAGQWILLQCVTAAAVSASYTPAGTVAAPTLTMASYTPTGTVAAPVLSMNSYTPAGTNANDGPPETFTGTPATLTGTNSAPAFTGAAHTLTGTNSAPAFTGTPATLTGTTGLTVAAPNTGSIISMALWFDGSSVTIDGL